MGLAERRLIGPLQFPPTAIRSMGDRSRGPWRRREAAPVRGTKLGHLVETARGRPATFGYQPITSGSPPLFNFAA
jgi:hypothetical protein